MKKKILASLLAVCMFVGLAVPAFAEHYSSVAGDPTKATIIDFADGGKAITELTIKEGDSKDIKDYVRVFEDKNTLITDKEYLEFSLEGDSLSFGIDGSVVNAIDKTGTTTVVVKGGMDSKAVGKLKIKAAPKATVRGATGFRFANTVNTLPVGAENTDVELAVVPVPNGSAFNSTQKSDIDAVVIPALNDVTSHATYAGVTNFNDGSTLTVSGLPQGKSLVLQAVKPTDPHATDASVTCEWDDDKNILTATVNAATAASRVSVASLQAAIRRFIRTATITNITSGEADNYVEVVAADTVTTTPVVLTKTVVDCVVTGDNKITSTLNDDNTKITYKIAKAQATNLIASVKKSIRVSADIVDGNNGTTTRTVTATTTVQNVEAKAAAAIGAPGTITIEVGEEFDTDGKLSFGPSTANVSKDYTLTLDYATTTSDAMDYASIDGKKILGVKTGVSKVIASLDVDSTKTATMIVKVVAKGEKPVPEEEKPSAPSHITAIVGGTTPIVVKNADGETIEFKSYDDKTATVAADGTVKGIKEGKAVIKVTVGDNDPLYVNVNVIAAPETTDPDASTGTDVPQTGVSFFAL